jgi:serine/threonine protein kinase
VELIRPLREGHFGEASLARLSTGETVVVKRLKALLPTHNDSGALGSDAALKSFQNEATVMSLLGNHPNLCKFVGACSEPGQQMIITEYCEGGSLDSAVLDPGGWLHGAPLGQRARMCLDVCRGLSSLHEARIVHADVAARNCLFDLCGQEKQLRAQGHRGAVRLADFGMSTVSRAEAFDATCFADSVGPRALACARDAFAPARAVPEE